MKFLMKAGFSSWVRVLVFLTLSIGAFALALIIPIEDAEDYIISKSVAVMGAHFAAGFICIMLVPNVTGNRCIRSSPIAKALYTRDIPLFFLLIGGGWMALFNCAYAAVILLTGKGAENISDMLLISAVAAAIVSLCSVFIIMRYGIVFMIYSGALIIVPYLSLPKLLRESGFGLPVWAAAVIFVLTCAVSTAAAMALARFIYKRVSFKPFAGENVMS